MSDELENIENVEDLETIPTGEVSGEVSGEVPEDNSAEIEAEQERLRREHEEYLNSFPETTVFYDRIIETDTYKCLGSWTKSAHTADSLGFLDNHRECAGFIPVQKNDAVVITSCLAGSINWAYFIPCQGNV